MIPRRYAPKHSRPPGRPPIPTLHEPEQPINFDERPPRVYQRTIHNLPRPVGDLDLPLPHPLHLPHRLPVPPVIRVEIGVQDLGDHDGVIADADAHLRDADTSHPPHAALFGLQAARAPGEVPDVDGLAFRVEGDFGEGFGGFGVVDAGGGEEAVGCEDGVVGLGGEEDVEAYVGFGAEGDGGEGGG